MTTEGYVCCLCETKFFNSYGNNPAPLKNTGECCDECNKTKVIPARLKAMGLNP